MLWRRLLKVPWTARRSNLSIQSWVFIGRTDVEAEIPVLWPPDAKSWLIWKDPDAGKDRRQQEKGTTEDEMVGWHHWLNGHEFGLTLGVGDGQGGLTCCSPWGHRESDTTKRLNWTERQLLESTTYKCNSIQNSTGIIWCNVDRRAIVFLHFHRTFHGSLIVLRQHRLFLFYDHYYKS